MREKEKYIIEYQRAEKMIADARILKQKAILSGIKQGKSYRDMAKEIGGVTAQALSQFVKYK